MMIWALNVLALMITANPAVAAVCCGGHAAIPALITGYETTRLNSSFARSTLIGDAPAQGIPVFRRDGDRTSRSIFRLSGAHRWESEWQLGAGVNLARADFGDIDVNAAHLTFPRESILSLAPAGYFFAQVLIPTGTSVYELPQGQFSESEITGGGFARISLGTLWLTTYRKWDAFALGKAGPALERAFDQPNGSLRVKPGWTGDFMIGGGFALSSVWRLGGSVSAIVQEAKRTQASSGEWTTASSRLVWPASVLLTHFWDMRSTLNLAYEDETLIGPVRNTSLSRTVSLQYSYRWSRD